MCVISSIRVYEPHATLRSQLLIPLPSSQFCATFKTKTKLLSPSSPHPTRRTFLRFNYDLNRSCDISTVKRIGLILKIIAHVPSARRADGALISPLLKYNGGSQLGSQRSCYNKQFHLRQFVSLSSCSASLFDLPGLERMHTMPFPDLQEEKKNNP